MPLPCGLPARLSEAVEAYVNGRDNDRPVSMSRLVKATAVLMPELSLTKEELSDLIARKLVALGCNIHFDMGDASSPLHDDEERAERIRSRTAIDHGTPRSAR